MFTSPVDPHETLARIKNSQSLVHDLARDFLAAISESTTLIEGHVKVMTSILDSLTVGLVVVDAENRLVLTNVRAIELGVDPHADWMTQLREHFEFYFSEDGEAVQPGNGPIVRAMRERTPQRAEMFVTCEHYREGRWFRMTSDPIIDDEGLLQGAVSLFNDVTEQVRLRKELESLDSLITHDIKNHFAAVEGFLEFLHNDPDTALSPDALSVLNEFRMANCDQMQSLSILAHLRTAGVGSQSMAFVDVPVRTLVEGARDLVRQFMGFRRVGLSIKLSDDLPSVCVPQVAVLHVICNLLHNAVKYSRENGTVTVDAHAEADSVTLAVSDNGPGMSREELDTLFKPKLRHSRSRDGSLSSGLGLYLCRQIVNTSGGSLSCESSPGNGSTFFLRLPVTR